MCGIAGSFGAGAQEPPLALLRHRGPDAHGAVRVLLGNRPLWIGGARLAITAASAAHAMPCSFPRLEIVLAYVGEVYNWRELRSELGGEWETDGDAEVLARAWREWGPAALDRLVGMFAFALADRPAGTLHLVRDRAGEKPLYYAEHDGRVHFASEVKALGVPLAEAPCRDADALEFDCLRATPFRGVCAVLPSERIEIRAGQMRRASWWHPPLPAGDGSGPSQKDVPTLVQHAIATCGYTEGRSAVLVSGGLDSAIIQAVARTPRVYCLTFPADQIDPMDLARAAAPGAEIVPVTFGLREAEAALDKIAWHLDTPATWPALAYWFLAERMAADGVRVVLTGDGADELFGGYSRYRALWWLTRMRADPGLRGYGSLCDQAVGADREVLARMLDRGDADRARELVDEHGAWSAPMDLASRMARIDWHTTMQVNLRMVDRMMMAHGIENRSPFLDVRVVEAAFRLPGERKIAADESKAPLRAVARSLGVPESIVSDRQKVGLAVPWNRWRGVLAGPRGAWDRRDFADAMRAAWRRAFSLTPAMDASGE